MRRVLPPILGFAVGILFMLVLRAEPESELAPEAPTPEPVAEAVADEPDAQPSPAGIEPPPDGPEAIPDPGLSYRLLGTAASSDTGRAKAIVVHIPTGATAHVAVGELLAGAEVVEISSRRVQLLHPDGTISELRGSSGDSTPSEAPPQRAEVVPGASFIDHLASEQPRYIRDRFGGDFVAHYEDGQLLGWLVAPDPDRAPDALVDIAGLRTGDRIVGLNGLDLTDAATLEFLNQIPVPFEELIFRVVDLEGRERIAYERDPEASP